MGVKVHNCIEGARVFPHARDWYITDERVLQIYQEHDGDPEFVVMEYNRDGWEAVEWDPPIIPPQPAEEDEFGEEGRVVEEPFGGSYDGEGNRAEV